VGSGVRLGRRRSESGDAATELGRLVEADAEPDVGQLVRALSRAVVHVPMPGVAAVPVPRIAGAEDGDVPLYVLEDEDGRHALVYSSPRSLVEAWKSQGQTTAAAVRLPALLARWPSGTDLVLDAGLPQARVISRAMLEQVALDSAGVPTASALSPSPAGWDTQLPDPEPAQVIGATRVAAADLPEVRALWRAVTVDREPLARQVLTIVVDVEPGTNRERLDDVMSALAAAIAESDPQPVRLVAKTDEPTNHHQLIADVTGIDAPYWERSSS
jgi:hypothetical protein